MRNILRHKNIFFKLIAPFPAKSLVKIAEVVGFNQVIFKISPFTETKVFNIKQYSGINDIKIIEKNLNISCGENFPVYYPLLKKKFSFTEQQIIAPFTGNIEKLIFPSGNAIVKKIERKIMEINISASLNIKNNKILKYLNVQKGDSVKTSDILAKRLLSDNITLLIVVSPLNGKVINLDINKGSIFIKRDDIKEQIVNYIPGTIISLQEDVLASSITIESKGSILQGLLGWGKPREGYLVLLNSFKDIQAYSKDFLTNSIVIFKKPISINIIEKLIKLKIKGAVVPSLRKETLLSYRKEYQNKISILSVYFTGVDKLPDYLIKFFQFQSSAWAVMTTDFKEYPNILFLPKPFNPFEYFSGHLPEKGNEVLILNGEYRNTFGIFKKLDYYSEESEKVSYLPLAEIYIPTKDISIFISVNNIYY